MALGTMYILVTCTVGGNTGPFNLYSDVDGYSIAFETGVTAAQVTAGFFTQNAPVGTTVVRVQSTGACATSVLVPIAGVPTTTTTSTLPMVLPVVGTCCSGVVTKYIPYNPVYSIGSVVASQTEGFLGGYEVTGGPIPGTPDLVLYDATDYGTCGYFLAYWAGLA